MGETEQVFLSLQQMHKLKGHGFVNSDDTFIDSQPILAEWGSIYYVLLSLQWHYQTMIKLEASLSAVMEMAEKHAGVFIIGVNLAQLSE